MLFLATGRSAIASTPPDNSLPKRLHFAIEISFCFGGVAV
jgi:hypothetical protein